MREGFPRKYFISVEKTVKEPKISKGTSKI